MKSLPLILIALMLVVPAQAESEKPKFVWKPYLMSVMIGGAHGKSYEVQYDGRELRYYSAGSMFELKSAKPLIIKPTDEQWQKFFDEFERLKLSKWKRHYPNAKVHDGTYWRAFASYSTADPRDLLSSGSNSYPTNFNDFLKAVRDLIGGRAFE